MPKPEIVFDEDKHKYTVNGEVFTSVTTIINATVPKELAWWGMRVGITGVWTLNERGRLPKPMPNPVVLEDIIKAEKLTTNHMMWQRGDSGTSIHQAFENFGTQGTVPNPEDFPYFDRSRIHSLAEWLLENRPVFLENEVRTASLEHRFAGTYDAKIFFEAGEYKNQTALMDLKTSKYVYPESHYPQLEAYEAAEVECGEEPTDVRLILHLPEAAPASLHRSIDTFDDFKALMIHYQSILDRRERLKAGKKEAKRLAKEAKAA